MVGIERTKILSETVDGYNETHKREREKKKEKENDSTFLKFSKYL